MDLDKLYENKKKVVKQVTPAAKRKKLIQKGSTDHRRSFDEKYRRHTVYIENDTSNRIAELIEVGLITKKLTFINDALKSYLKRNF